MTSGLDIWFKRVDYPIVDRWYNKGHDHYHKDEGEGMDMYNVGKSRGAGGTGVWDGKQLYTGANYAELEGARQRAGARRVRAAYDSLGCGRHGGVRGQALHGRRRATSSTRSTAPSPSAGPPSCTVAVGLNKTPADKGQEPQIASSRTSDPSCCSGSAKSNGAIGTAIVLPGATGFAEDALNHLVLAKVESGKPLRYYAGGAWDRAGHIVSQEAWTAYVAQAAARAKSPIRVSLK